jgi:hypothetical protein
MMNELIRELWHRAAECTAAYPSGQNNSWETQVNFMDKFAELIVKECVTTLERHHPFTKDPEAYLYAISLIEEHFGVEG